MSPVPAAALSLAFVAALAACGQRDGHKAGGDSQISAEGKAEEGKITVKGAGVDLTFVLPKGMRGEAKAGQNSKILYPGSTIQGMALVGGEGHGKNGGDSEVEFSFTTPDSRDKVLAWYRDPARAADIRVTGVERDGDDIVVRGGQDAKHVVKIRLADRAAAGTAGRVTIHHDD